MKPVLGVVPARGGSKRLPRKNLARLGGASLVRRALDSARASGALELTVLSSEDAEILAEADGLEGVLAIPRPPELATDGTNAFGAVVHALEAAESATGAAFGAIAVLQCTSPLTAPEDIAGAIEHLERSGADSVVSVVRAEHHLHPLKMKRMEGDRLVPLFEDDRMAPSHELPNVWVRNGSIYASLRGVIEGGKLIAEDVRGYPMPRERSVDVDTPLDLAFAEFLLGRQEAER